MSQTPWKNMPPWEDITVPARNTPYPLRLGALIAELDVENAARYRPSTVDGKSKTFCNIYATDIVRNMGFRAPTHWMTSKGEPATLKQGIEQNANAMFNWLGTHGGAYGWWKADLDTAVDAAKRGHLVLAIWKNPQGPGHVAVVTGEKDGVVRITQAGAVNHKDTALGTGFGKKEPDYWIQAEREGGHT